MVLPVLAAAGEGLAALGIGSTLAGLADDIPAIASLIMKHGEAQDEPPEQQAQREQQIVAKRDELVAKLVKGGMPPEKATAQVNEQLAPLLQQAKNRAEGDHGGSIAGPLIGAAVGLLPGLGALRGGLGAAKAAYSAAAGAPAVFGKAGQIAKGLGAGQWSLMKSGVMGAPKGMEAGASSPWMPTGASSPMPGASSPIPGATSRIDPAAQVALNRLGRGRAPMSPPNAAGAIEATNDPGERGFQRAEFQPRLTYTPPGMNEDLMRRLALAKLAPQGVEIE